MQETLLFQSATDVARRLRLKELSSRELTEMLLTRIEAVNPALNAVVELRGEAAFREAVAADNATAHGDAAGPLRRTHDDQGQLQRRRTAHHLGNPAFAISWRTRIPRSHGG